MDVIFIDQKGNKKNFLYQYDKGQYLVIKDWEYDVAPKVEYQMGTLKTALSVTPVLEGTTVRCRIPDTLIAIGDDIVVYLYVEDAARGEVVMTFFISVRPRKRPSDYTFPSEMFAISINGTTISSIPGFGEVAMWEDGNPNKETRYGYFVNVTYGDDGLTIKKATSVNDVYGVVIDRLGFAANCPDDRLASTGYLKTDYGFICCSGFATVIDNGRCTVGGMCVPNSDGTAIPTTNTVGFKVLDRVDSTHILIFTEPSMGTINYFQDNINTINTNISNHLADQSNPHAVTAEQVGLGLVPNVTTNDQTPTYTVATTLTKLTSGEKLSTAFGKIAKAIVVLIAHIANKSNPHEVTRAQVGLGNVDNTADVDKPVSTAVNLELTRIEELVNTTQENIDAHSTRTDNPHSVTAEQVGLGNVNNTSDMDKPISTAVQTALDKKASLVDGKIPKEQLPDDSFDNIVVETIADRDALSPFAGLLVHVKDASGDSSVSSAYADYIYDGETWAITGGATGSSGTADSVSWANITGKPSSYIPSAHASTHATGGSDPIIPADIGAVSQTDFDTLVETVNNLATLTDATTGAQYTLGVNAGKLLLVPYGEEVEPIANGDQTAY